MRIMRLLAIAGLSYAAYRVYQDVQEEAMWRRGGERRELEQALDEESGRMQTLTGPGRGETTSTGDAGGAMRNVTVGRGVVES